jgi:hypothetical protein
MKIEEAKQLKCGDYIYIINEHYKSSGGRKRLKVNGMPKLWKRDPERIRIPVKYGLYDTGEVTNGTWEGGRYTYHLKDVSLNDV